MWPHPQLPSALLTHVGSQPRLTSELSSGLLLAVRFATSFSELFQAFSAFLYFGIRHACTVAPAEPYVNNLT